MTKIDLFSSFRFRSSGLWFVLTINCGGIFRSISLRCTWRWKKKIRKQSTCFWSSLQGMVSTTIHDKSMICSLRSLAPNCPMLGRISTPELLWRRSPKKFLLGWSGLILKALLLARSRLIKRKLSRNCSRIRRKIASFQAPASLRKLWMTSNWNTWTWCVCMISERMSVKIYSGNLQKQGILKCSNASQFNH